MFACCVNLSLFTSAPLRVLPPESSVFYLFVGSLNEDDKGKKREINCFNATSSIRKGYILIRVKFIKHES